RDHLLKTWVTALSPKNFPEPLFYNNRKQEDFLAHLKEVEDYPAGGSALRFCPGALALWTRTKPKYVISCGKHGCTQGAPTNVPQLASFSRGNRGARAKKANT